MREMSAWGCGDGVCRWGVWASDGSLPAGGPLRHEARMFHSNNNTEKPIMNAPTVSNTFNGRKPVSMGYLEMRRTMPDTPRMCIGKKVMLKPMVISQKCQAARLSLYSRPVTFGNQKYNPASRANTLPPKST